MKLAKKTPIGKFLLQGQSHEAQLTLSGFKHNFKIKLVNQFFFGMYIQQLTKLTREIRRVRTQIVNKRSSVSWGK